MTVNLADVEKFLENMRIPIRLGCKTQSGWPMVISLWYKYEDHKLYCATTRTARIVSYIESNSQVAYEIASDLPPYCGVRGQAKAEIDPDLGPQVLEDLLNRYLGDLENPLAQTLLKNQQNEVAIVLDPVNSFRWDFTPRMQEVAPAMISLTTKVCP
jgi:hypothetical protein